MRYSKREAPSGPAREFTDCKTCGAKESIITHTKDGNTWCYKCHRIWDKHGIEKLQRNGQQTIA